MFGLLVPRYLIARRGMSLVVTAFSLLGITLGVAALIVVLSVMAGFREELTNKILGVTGHAVVGRVGLTLPEAEEYKRRLMDVPEVLEAEPYVLGQAMLVSGNVANGAMVRGVVPEQANLLVKDKIIRGSWEGLEEGKGVVVGDGLADAMGLRLGSALTLLSPQGTQTAFGFIPRMQKFRVVGIFSVGMYQYDSGVIFMDVKEAQTFFRRGEEVTGIDLRVTEPSNFSAIMPKLREAIGLEPSIRPWMDSNKPFFDALQVERVTMFIILTLIVVVAAFNIITGQTMAVQDKRNDIAILRTMGATRNGILMVFFLNGLLIGGLGTAAGVGLGFLVLHNLQAIVMVVEGLLGVDVFAAEVYFLDALPGQVVPSDIIWVVVMSLVLSVLASLYPAWLAGRTSPVEVLRNG